MILKMSAVTLIYVVLTVVLWKKTRDKQMTNLLKVAVGIVYGVMAILSTHFGIDYGDMMLNVRDLGPMSAGLFFDPVSGIIAGLIGGIERYIAGTYFNVGAFTRIACSISTCFAGFFAAFLQMFIFKGKRPSVAYAFFMGAVIEVFHMYIIFATHRNDMQMASFVVEICSVPMILFSGFGLALIALNIRVICGEWYNPLKPIPREEVPVSNRFQVWLFGVTAVVLALNFGFSFMMQTQSAMEGAKTDLQVAIIDIKDVYTRVAVRGGDKTKIRYHVGLMGTFHMFDEEGNCVAGSIDDGQSNNIMLDLMDQHEPKEFFTAEVYGAESLCLYHTMEDSGIRLFVEMPLWDIYEDRNNQAIETMLADILLFTVVYVLISMLVQSIVVDNLILVNKSLGKITDGDLDEQVSVYDSLEFASLSNDINKMVFTLKGYIAAAERRLEQELLLAHNIQDASLPKEFTFAHDGFEVYATMHPAKQVGGDFYDFFFVDVNKIALVIADVSDKGIPAALFMMRSKSSIRSLAETGSGLTELFYKVNNELCEGNDINMFVTVWMGIMDLANGTMKCVNAGHEYPAIMRGDGDFELFKDKHFPPVGVIEDMKYTEYELQLKPGDCLYLYTDGVTDAINADEEQYGLDRMFRAVNDNKGVSMEELLTNVKVDIDVFAGDTPPFDDITMMGFRYKGMK